MEPGYIVDVMYGHGNAAVPKWVAGEPQRSISTGIKLRGEGAAPRGDLPLRQCGYLESCAAG